MTLLIIDGDVLAYHACKPRWEKKARIEGNTSFVSLDEKGQRVALEYTKEEDRKYLEESWENFKKGLKNLLEVFYTDEYLMAVKGPDNFRGQMYPEYKMNRHADPSKQNKFVPHLRKLAVLEDLAVEAVGLEADDLVRMWAIQASEAGQDFVIASIDKDLKCIPGRHFNMKHETVTEVSVEEARRHYYEQLLKGDPTDNIPGVPRVGEVKAKKILSGCKTDEDFQELIVEQYMSAYGDDWKSYLLSNGKMIHLMRNSQDYFNFSEWPIIKEL